MAGQILTESEALYELLNVYNAVRINVKFDSTACPDRISAEHRTH
jgi:metal-sulfur cluster biosynthetic enzyme